MASSGDDFPVLLMPVMRFTLSGYGVWRSVMFLKLRTTNRGVGK